MKRSDAVKRIRLPVLAMRELDSLYAELPQIKCKGLCFHSCTVILMGKLEYDRIAVKLGRHPKDKTFDMTGNTPCVMLTKEKKCSVYELRPAICRLYGVVEGMRCPHGCEVERVLTDKESADWTLRVMSAQAEYAGTLKGVASISEIVSPSIP